MAAPALENFELAAALSDLTNWLIQQGLENVPVDIWLEECCNRLVAAGIPLQRVNITTRAHHPEIGTLAFRWHRGGENERLEYQRRETVGDEYLKSPIYYLLANDLPEVRHRLDDPDLEHHFPIYDELRERGATEYFATKKFFLKRGDTQEYDPLRPQEGMIISMTTDQEGGFTDAQLNGLRALLSPISLTIKSSANRAMAEDITAAYLGADASRRVLSGDIRRGSSETLSAVIWYFDLQNFTKLSEELGGAPIIELLNDYFGEVCALVEEGGGNVLKFMGDGMLAIYDLNEVADARAVAVDAAARLPGMFKEINARRAADGLPTTGFTLGLHAGDVLYGNIGGKTRLDFTVIGPAVNTTARILGMSDAVDQEIVISSAVARPLIDSRPDLVSLGKYRLRGVRDRQELFTLD